MGIQNDIKLWDQVQVRVLDVRLISLETNEFIRNYVLPTSTFVYVQGRGRCGWMKRYGPQASSCCCTEEKEGV